MSARKDKVIKLENIQVVDGKIVATVIVYGDSVPQFNIIVNIKTDEIESMTIKPEMCFGYHMKAKRELIKLYDKHGENMPKEQKIVWY